MLGGRRQLVGTFSTREEAVAGVEQARADYASGAKPIGDESAWMPLKVYAARIGVRPGTVGRWVHEGMPVMRWNGLVRIDAAKADAWVSEHKSGSVSFERDGVVYAVRRESDGAVKFGWSSDLSRRIHELRKESDEQVTLIGAVPGDKRKELRIQGRLTEDRLDGEWFRPSTIVLQFLNEIEEVWS
jgi:hypothetical protein